MYSFTFIFNNKIIIICDKDVYVIKLNWYALEDKL